MLNIDEVPAMETKRFDAWVLRESGRVKTESKQITRNPDFLSVSGRVRWGAGERENL